MERWPLEPGFPWMGKQMYLALYAVLMAAVIVGVDFAFLRDRFWIRLAVNIGIVLAFAVVYLRFLRYNFP
jgi:hypothetical protein